MNDFVQEWIENDLDDYEGYLDYRKEHYEIWEEEVEL